MYYYEWIVQNVPSVDVIKWSINFGKLLSTVFYTVDGQKYISAGMIELSTVFFSFFVKDNWVKFQRGHKINTNGIIPKRPSVRVIIGKTNEDVAHQILNSLQTPLFLYGREGMMKSCPHPIA